MGLRIWQKLFLAFILVAALVVVVALVLTRFSLNRGFVAYLNQVETQRLEGLAEELEGIYRVSNSWNVLIQDPRMWRELMDDYTGARRPGKGVPEATAPPRRQRPPHRRPPPREPAPLVSPIDLLDADRRVLFGRPGQRSDASDYAIESAGEVIGILRYVPLSVVTDLDEDADRQFVRQQTQALWGVSLVALAVAALVSLLIARQLVAPVRILSRGTQALAAGRLEERLPVLAEDELGELAQSFNSMAEALEKNRAASRQWMVDIAHELRTPLTIIAGELQAVEDGVRPLSEKTMESLQSEVDVLRARVDDLHELSLSDSGSLSYQFAHFDLRAALVDVVESQSARIENHDLELTAHWPSAPVRVKGDERRLRQVLSNLLENSLRYTDAGGSLRVTGSVNDAFRLTVEDSAPGVPSEAYSRLFDRLYRVEESRSRARGGSGLGLAICKGIVEAHGGTIAAGPSPLGGLRVEVELPLDG